MAVGGWTSLIQSVHM